MEEMRAEEYRRANRTKAEFLGQIEKKNTCSSSLVLMERKERFAMVSDACNWEIGLVQSNTIQLVLRT